MPVAYLDLCFKNGGGQDARATMDYLKKEDGNH
jgi:hypothetical protein